jgi:hypothetical protein
MELQKEVGHYLSDVFLSEYNLLLQIKSEIFKRPWVLQEPFVFSCFHISKVLISNLRSIPYSEDSTECFLIAGIHKEIHIRVATFPVYNH